MPQILFEVTFPGFQFNKRNRLKAWVYSVIDLHNKDCGLIKFTFCGDDYLLKLNSEYLNHDTLTDIITFNYNEGNTLSGEIYISVERVHANAAVFNSDFETELYRVMIHGILHLIGLNDKTRAEKETMRSAENQMLSLLAF